MSESYTVITDSPYPCVQIEREYWYDGEPAGTIVIELSVNVLEEMLAKLKYGGENSFVFEGSEYVAVEEIQGGSCDRCKFYALSDACAAHDRPPCVSEHRKDGRGIIWRAK